MIYKHNSQKKLNSEEKNNSEGSWSGAQHRQKCAGIIYNISAIFEDAGKEYTPRPSGLNRD